MTCHQPGFLPELLALAGRRGELRRREVEALGGVRRADHRSAMRCAAESVERQTA